MGTQIQVITPWLCIETHGDDWGSPCVSIACHSYNFPGLNPISVSCRATICWMKAAKFIIPTAFCFCSCVSAWHQQLLWATSKHTHTRKKRKLWLHLWAILFVTGLISQHLFSQSWRPKSAPLPDPTAELWRKHWCLRYRRSWAIGYQEPWQKSNSNTKQHVNCSRLNSLTVHHQGFMFGPRFQLHRLHRFRQRTKASTHLGRYPLPRAARPAASNQQEISLTCPGHRTAWHSMAQR